MSDARHEWHVAINRHHDTIRPKRAAWMYEAKEAAFEVPRLTLLHAMERKGELRKVHQQCSHAQPVPVLENHLTCCLGVKCRACPELLALDAMKVDDPADIDQAKAWTCVAHIVSSGGDVAREGYLMTVDDRMYWDRVYSNMAYSDTEPTEDLPAPPRPEGA